MKQKKYKEIEINKKKQKKIEENTVKQSEKINYE